MQVSCASNCVCRYFGYFRAWHIGRADQLSYFSFDVLLAFLRKFAVQIRAQLVNAEVLNRLVELFERLIDRLLLMNSTHRYLQFSPRVLLECLRQLWAFCAHGAMQHKQQDRDCCKSAGLRDISRIVWSLRSPNDTLFNT